MKQIFSLLCTLALCAMVAVGCSDDNDDAVKKTYTVTFDSQGGSAVSAQTVKEGEKVAEPAAPTKAGVVFGGWYTSTDYAKAWDFDKSVVTEDITLYARWASESVTVRFDTNGGNEIAEQKVAKGGLLGTVPVPVKAGSAFDGWYTDKALTAKFNASSPIDKDITLYAKWTSISKESLQTLISEANSKKRGEYTEESYDKMWNKLNAAQDIVNKTDATKEEIETAYEELSKAINALLPLEKRETVGFYIAPTPIGDIIYINPKAHYETYTEEDKQNGYYEEGEDFGILAYGTDASDNESSNCKVIFSYDGLNDWAIDGNISEENTEEDSSLYFILKQDLAIGKSISITIKSADNTALSKTITLKVITSSEAKAKYIELMNSLPATNAINFDNFEDANNKYNAAGDIYDEMELADKKSSEVKTLKARRDEYYKALDCIWKAYYKFKGNTCIITEGSSNYFDFVSNGAFPAGIYTETINDDRYQSRITLKDNQTFIREERSRTNEDSDWGKWGIDSEGKYKLNGTNEKGVIYFQITKDFDDEPVINRNISRARKANIRAIRK